MTPLITIEVNDAGVQDVSTLIRDASDQKKAARFLEHIADAVEQLHQAASSTPKARTAKRKSNAAANWRL